MSRVPAILLMVVLGLFAIGLGGSVGAAPPADNPQADPEVVAPAGGAEAIVVDTRCGISKGVRIRVVDSPFMWTIPENAFTLLGVGGLTGAAAPGLITWVLPPGVSDCFILTFSAEAQLRGTTSPFDWIELEARATVAGMTTFMEPHGGAGDPVALAGPSEYRGDGYTFFARLSNTTDLAQLVVIRMYVKLQDNGVDNDLIGWVDDYTLYLEVRD